MSLTRTMLALAAVAAAAAADYGGEAGSAGGGQSQQQQHAQSLQNLPDKAKQALLKEAMQHEARVSNVDRKDSAGLMYYSAKLENQDRSWTVKVTDQGTVIGMQAEQFAFEKLPKPVQDAFIKEAGQDGMITEIVTTRRNGQKAYKAEIETEGKGRDIVVSESGQKLPAVVQQSQQGASSGAEGGISGQDQQDSQLQKEQKEQQQFEQQRKDLEKDLEKIEKDLEKERKELQQSQ